MVRDFYKTALAFLPLTVAITGISGLIYVVVHQNYRQTANDPQIQISEDTALLFANGAKPQSLIPTNQVDIGLSLAPFTMIYDSEGKLLASNATLNGKQVNVPEGVLDYTRTHGIDRVTWQPVNGVRSAVVVTRASNGFVVVGRSLREIERREQMLTWSVMAAWGVTIIGTLFVMMFLTPLSKKR